MCAHRRAFRGLSTQQRQILSDADAFAERADGERSLIESKPEEERTPEETIRAVQLEQMGVYLQRARERMGHARRELRGRRGERAYRRSAAAVDPSSVQLGSRFTDGWGYGFTLGWELDFWGRFRRAVVAADEKLDASVADYDGVLVRCWATWPRTMCRSARTNGGLRC